ncbi:MAG: MFS transporter [Chloroflexota bacterium]|nr:MFS transporter [Chloroflexota bacterium]
MNLHAARGAVMTYFFVAGMATGSWFPRIPEVQRELDLSHGELGLALVGPAVGALLAMPATGWLIARTSSRIVATSMALLLCAVLPLPATAGTALLLFIALAALGAANGVLDVSMNVQAVGVEKRYRRPIMSAFHGVFSVGGLAGAAGAGLAAAAGIGPRAHLLIVAIVMAIVTVIASLWLLPAATDEVHDGPVFVRLPRPLVGLGLIAFCALVGEGAMADWSAVYLGNTLNTSPAFAAAGYAVFAAAMVVGRFAGDWATARLQPVRVIRYGGALVAIGLGLGLGIGQPWSALLGFACVGIGLSCAFPVLLSVAGQTSNLAPGVAISAVATLGYSGFLAGPPVIGFVAEVTGLRVGLGLVAGLGVAMVLMAGLVDRPAAAPSG